MSAVFCDSRAFCCLSDDSSFVFALDFSDARIFPHCLLNSFAVSTDAALGLFANLRASLAGLVTERPTCIVRDLRSFSNLSAASSCSFLSSEFCCFNSLMVWCASEIRRFKSTRSPRAALSLSYKPFLRAFEDLRKRPRDRTLSLQYEVASVVEDPEFVGIHFDLSHSKTEMNLVFFKLQ